MVFRCLDNKKYCVNLGLETDTLVLVLIVSYIADQPAAEIGKFMQCVCDVRDCLFASEINLLKARTSVAPEAGDVALNSAAPEANDVAAVSAAPEVSSEVIFRPLLKAYG